MYNRLKTVFEEELPQYDYEIIFVDDYSPDNTRAEIRKLCKEDKRVKAVFNAKNFGFNRNVLPLCFSVIARTRRKYCHR